MASATTNQTALCIIPPENVWEQIQSIRSIHDRAYPRWMPHINLIYPFVSESNFDNIKTHLEPILNRKKPFEIQFDESSFHYFEQKDDKCTYHLIPKINTDVVVELQKLIQNQLKNIIRNKRAFEAHLTLGQTKISQISNVLNDIKMNWTTIEFIVDRIYMISRENHPENLFTIKKEILLLDQKEEESIPLAISNLTLNPINSSARYYLCIIPSNQFSSCLFHLFERTSFRSDKSFQIILAEYEDDSIISNLRLKLESTPQFTLHFGQDSLNYDEITSRLFLKPIDMEPLHRLNILDNIKYDGTLTLGELDKKDFDKVNDRFTRSFSSGLNEIKIDRIRLIDKNERIKFIFRLN